MIFIQREEADRNAITEMVQRSGSGCVVQFIGVVRDNSEGKEVSNMTVEVYEEMARKQLEDIRAECKAKFGVQEVAIVHRYGEFKVGDELVFIAISAGKGGVQGMHVLHRRAEAEGADMEEGGKPGRELLGGGRET